MTDIDDHGAASGPKPRALTGPEILSPATPKKRERKAKDPLATFRQASWRWLAVRPKRVRAVPAKDPVAAFRRAAWEQFHAKPAAPKGPEPLGEVARAHLKAVLEALIFAAEEPMSLRELAKSARADSRVVKPLLAELVEEYRHRGFRLDEIAGGYLFRTSPAFAPFVREQVAKKPVRMSRAQVETLAIVAYRQPVTRPEVDDVRGVDSGAALKSLLERDLVRILGKKDEPGRPMIYGTTSNFLSFFGLRALADLPTLREFTELSDESKRTFERELGEEPPDDFAGAAVEGLMGGEGDLRRSDVEIVDAVDDEESSFEAGAGEVAAANDAAPPGDEDAPPGDEDEDEEDDDDDDEDDDDDDDDDEDEDDEDEDEEDDDE